MKKPPQQPHIPVLLTETVQLLNPRIGDRYLDLTAGYGGHAREVISATKSPERAVLCDRDANALSSLSDLSEQGSRLMHGDFKSACDELAHQGSLFDMILLDIGVSSPQLDQGERGFAFSHPGVLDMRMDQRQSLTAAEVVNKWPVSRLKDILVEYGELSPHKAEQLAIAIGQARKRQPIDTTDQLAELVRIKIGQMDGGKYHKVHPATVVFQAIRIAVNDELGQLEATLPKAIDLLAQGGRLAVISFHSLEDRIVKRIFRDHSLGLDGDVELLTKKPIDGKTNDVYNPRSRSAMLRAVVKK